MLNQTVMVGRLTQDPEIKELEDDRKVATITVAVPRSYKNAEGVYETDFIKYTLWAGIAGTATEYCKKGDLVGIKGRLQCTDSKLEVIAEKVSFLSSSKKDDGD